MSFVIKNYSAPLPDGSVKSGKTITYYDANGVEVTTEEYLPNTPAEWVDMQGFAGNRSTTMLYLKLKLDAAQLVSPKLSAVQKWLDQMIVAGITNPTETKEDWPPTPYSFEDASGEALTLLQ